MAHDFNMMATTLGYPGEKEMFEGLYGTMSLQELSTALRISTALCRKKLAQHGIPMRKRGGPNGLKLVMTQEIIDEMQRLGSAAVALKYKVARYTLFKQKAAFLKDQQAKKAASDEATASPECPGQEPQPETVAPSDPKAGPPLG